MSEHLTFRSTPARPFLAVSTTPQVAYVLLEVQPAAETAQVRARINVAFVLDHSGSMKGEKIERLRRATLRAVELLDPQDIASIVVFDHRVDVLVPAQPAADRAALTAAVGRIRDGGGTRIAPAIEVGLREVARGPADAVRRLLLLTDGQTEGERDCLRVADDAGRASIPITALGMGNDWNEELLDAMAQRSNGEADYIDQPDAIADYFKATVQRAQASSVQNAQLTLHPAPGVTPRAIWQVVPLISNLGFRPVNERDVAVALGDVEAGVGRGLLFELLIDPRAAGQYRIGEVEVGFDIPQQHVFGAVERTDLLLNFADLPAQTAQVNAPVMNIVEKVSAFKLQTRALQDLQAGDVSAATQKLQSAVTRLLSQGELELAQTMEREIDNLNKTGRLSSEGQKTMKFGTRKTVRLNELDLPKE